MKRKKVVFFVSGGVGGAERVTITIAKLLDKEKIDVKLVITDFPDCPLSKFTPKSLPVIYLSEKHLRWGCMMKMKIFCREKERIMLCIHDIRLHFTACDMQIFHPKR